MAKYFAAESAIDIINKSLQLHGGYGYSREYEIERLYRDIRVLGRTDSAGKKWFGRYGASGWIWFYRLLSCVCAVLVCLAALVIAGRLFFGEAFFWKLSGSPLEVIGTESLLQ